MPKFVPLEIGMLFETLTETYLEEELDRLIELASRPDKFGMDMRSPLHAIGRMAVLSAAFLKSNDLQYENLIEPEVDFLLFVQMPNMKPLAELAAQYEDREERS